MSGLKIHGTIIRVLLTVVLLLLALNLSCTTRALTDGIDDTGGTTDDDTTGDTTDDDTAGPTAALQAYNAEGDAPLTVGLDASGSSAGAGIASYDYDFDGDGTWDETAGESSTSYIYTVAGTFTATVRVTDANGGTDTATATVTVTGSSSVVVADLEIYPTTAAVGDTVILDASGSGPNDGTLVFEYDVDGDGDYDATGTDTYIEHTYNSAGTYNVKVRVTTTDGVSDTATAGLTITGGDDGGGDDEVDPPFVELDYYPEAVTVGDTVTLDASNSWARDLSDLEYDYDYEGDGTWEVLATGNSTTCVYTAAGTYNPVVRVRDESGRESTATVEVTVSAAAGEERAPTAVLTASPTAGTVPLEVSFSAGSSYDTDGTVVRYDWDFGDGTVINDGAAAQSHTYQSAGTFTATVTVTDDDGLTDSADTEITVNAATATGPTAQLSADPLSGEAPLLVSFDAAGSTAGDAAINSYGFDFDGDGTWDQNSAAATAEHTFTATGTYNATVTVIDADGLTSTTGVTVTVSEAGAGSPPVVIVTADVYYGASPLTVTFYCGYSYDNDGTIVGYDWDLDNDGTYETTDGGTGQVLEFTESGSHTVGVRATDDDGNTATGTASVYVE